MNWSGNLIQAFILSLKRSVISSTPDGYEKWENLTLNELVKQIDTVAQKYLPLAQPLSEELIAWASLHGWNASVLENQRLLIRQALFNSILQQLVPALEDNRFATPLDTLGLAAPQMLIDATHEARQSLEVATFNFWGEFYSSLIPQARRRHIGQFWTSELIAEWMTTWLLQFQPRCLADVGCGAGNFLLKAAQYLTDNAADLKLYGSDISPLLLNTTLAAFLTTSFRGDERTTRSQRPMLAVQNYLNTPLPEDVDAVICNPPYTRHHHIQPELKDYLQALFKSRFHIDVSRQGTLAYYFLLKLIADMPDGAQATVIAPMETVDARYGWAARRILCQYTTLVALVHFAPQMNAFRNVDVGASILLFRKGYQKQNQVCHLTLKSLPTTPEFLDCLATDQPQRARWPFGSLVLQPQDELLETSKWFSVATSPSLNTDLEESGLIVPLKVLAKVVRGIATGANEFFALPSQKVKEYSLEPFVVRTLQRNREAQDIIFDEAAWQALSDEGKSVWLLYLNGGNFGEHPHLSAYLAEGETKGYPQRSLLQTRKRWYAMEQREVPAVFFTILTRGNPRFILNRAGVRPLNMFSLIYPNRYVTEAGATELLWVLLNSNFSLSRLHSVSRTYGGNTLKVEPRELDNLPVINPLALPDDIRQKIRGWINDFYGHRQATVLLNQIDALIKTLLATETPAKSHLSLPLQLRLLETDEDGFGE
jgi:methylase of polypeptide subunit release factors